MAKMGRPSMGEEAKRYSVTFRLDRETILKVCEIAEKNHESRTDVIRRAIDLLLKEGKK